MVHNAGVTDTRTRHEDTLVIEHAHIKLGIMSDPPAVPGSAQILKNTTPTIKRNSPSVRLIAHLGEADTIRSNNEASRLSVESESVMCTAFS
jgi:hypothetical protein